MAAQQKPETKQESTSVALVNNAAIGELPATVQHQLELRKLSNQIAGKLAELNWGQKLDLATRRAIADWGHTYGVDPATEIHVLGGNIYLNAAYYLRRLASLIERGVVEYAYADHVEHDDRLEALGADGVGEKNRRLRERITHQIAEKAASAVVFRVKLSSMQREVVGVKWCGNGTQKNDPVGDAKPVETSESRAARRAMRQIVTHMPDAAQEILAVEDAAETLSERVSAATASFDDAHPRQRIQSHTGLSDRATAFSRIPVDDPYASPVINHEMNDREPGDEDDDEHEPNPFD